jgi:predicted ATPase
MHTELQNLLRRRVEIIADRAFYDRDPAAHLQALREVSEAIDKYASTHNREFDPKLRHYLSQSSYQKALEHLAAKLLP